jgi:hypothetical protein
MPFPQVAMSNPTAAPAHMCMFRELMSIEEIGELAYSL